MSRKRKTPGMARTNEGICKSRITLNGVTRTVEEWALATGRPIKEVVKRFRHRQRDNLSAKEVVYGKPTIVIDESTTLISARTVYQHVAGADFVVEAMGMTLDTILEKYKDIRAVADILFCVPFDDAEEKKVALSPYIRIVEDTPTITEGEVMQLLSVYIPL